MRTLTRTVRGRPLHGGRSRRWSDLSDRQRTAVVAPGLVELTLTTAAAVDLSRDFQPLGPWPLEETARHHAGNGVEGPAEESRHAHHTRHNRRDGGGEEGGVRR
jgi:hypothetical protein